jgi:predicted SAM-dependent methyltransferase
MSDSPLGKGYPHMRGLMVAIPHTGRPLPPQWAWGLKNMHIPMNFNTNFAAVYGQPVDKARQMFAEEAVRLGTKYLFFLGEDNVAPPYAIPQLIYSMEQSDAAVVAGIYNHKGKPHNPMIFRGNGAGCYWDWRVGELFEITGCGMDCTLIRVEVLKDLPKPWFKTIDDITPAYNAIPSGSSWTEDLFFTKLLTDAGHKIYADAQVLCDHLDIKTGEKHPLPAGSKPTARFSFPDGLAKAIDLGCGSDKITIKGAHVFGVDIREEEGVDFRCGVGKLPFADGSFDIVYSSHVLEHFPADLVQPTLDEWVRLMKPNGEFRLVLPNVEWAGKKLAAGEYDQEVKNVLYGAQTYTENFHKFGFTPDLIVGMLKDRGFTKIDVQLIHYHIAIRAWKVAPAKLNDEKDTPCAYQPACVPGDLSKVPDVKPDTVVSVEEVSVKKLKKLKRPITESTKVKDAPLKKAAAYKTKKVKPKRKK